MRIAIALLFLVVALPTRAQYVVPPYPPPKGDTQVLVPPYPAPAPDRFPSAAEFLYYSNWRLGQLSARERALTILGRTDTYRARKTGAIVVMGVGAAMFAGGYGYFYLSQGSESELRKEKIAGGVLGLGLGVTLGGLIWLYVEKHNQPYRVEIHELQREQASWRREQHRARRQVRLSFNGLQLKF